MRAGQSLKLYASTCSHCCLVQEWMAEEAGGYSGLEFVGPQEVPGWGRVRGRDGSD